MVWSKKPLIADRSCSIAEDFPKDVAYRLKKLFPIFAKGRKTTSTDKKSLSLKADVLIPAVGFLYYNFIYYTLHITNFY